MSLKKSRYALAVCFECITNAVGFSPTLGSAITCYFLSGDRERAARLCNELRGVLPHSADYLEDWMAEYREGS